MDERRLEAFDAGVVEALRRSVEETGKAMTPAIQKMIEIARRPVMAPEVLEKLRGMSEAAARMDEQMAHLRANVLEAGVLSAQAAPDLLSDINIPRPTQAYMLDAQYDTIEVIRGMGALLQQSLEVQSKQAEELQDLRKNADQQTRLTRWVLAFAVASVSVGLLGIAAMVMVAFLV